MKTWFSPDFFAYRDRLLEPATGRAVSLAQGPVVMGILNITPDSFFPGSRSSDPQEAADRALAMVEAGASILDIGGESSRPGAPPVDPEQELRRVIPVIRAIRAMSSVPLSVDTRRASVARAAMEAGTDWINDIAALGDDPALAEVVASTGACVVLMHRQGDSLTMQRDPQYGNVVVEVRDFLARRRDAALHAGIREDRILLDPGVGFGKTLEHNLQLLRGLPEFLGLGCPLVLGVSRKSFLQKITGAPVDDRLPGSLASGLQGALAGASVLRVHDPGATVQALKTIRAILEVAPC